MITRRLLEGGDEVRILVRQDSPSEELARQGLATSAGSLIEAGAQPVYGDIKDRASLDQACVGTETVITTANSAMRGGEDNVDTVDREGNRSSRPRLRPRPICVRAGRPTQFWLPISSWKAG